MTQAITEANVTKLLGGAYDFCTVASKHVFKTLEVDANTGEEEWDKIRQMMLAICEGHADQVLLVVITDDDQRRRIARGIAFSAMEEAANFISRRWP